MNTCLHQSDPVETSMEEEENPPLNKKHQSKSVQPSQQVQPSHQHQHELNQTLQKLISSPSDQYFTLALKQLNTLFAKGYSPLLTNQTQLHKKMMSHFIKLSKSLETNTQAQSEMLFILSLIAEMIKESPSFSFPFTKKFLHTVFEIDNQSLEHSPYKNQILAILSVIYHNLSLQGRLIKKLNVEKELKLALLTNYSLINQLFTLKLFNRSVLNLASKGLTFTSTEFSKYGILDTISKFIAQNQVQVFLARMKTCMFQVKPKLQQAKKLIA